MNTFLQLVGLAPEHRDVITTGGQVLIAMAGVIIAYLETNRRQTKKARRASEQAAEQTVPTGNGFAAKVLEELREVRRDVGGMRGELRDVRGELKDVRREQHHQGRRLDNHLDERNQP